MKVKVKYAYLVPYNEQIVKPMPNNVIGSSLSLSCLGYSYAYLFGHYCNYAAAAHVLKNCIKNAQN